MDSNISKYTAVICAAGQGKRLGSLAENCPKTLVKVGDKTILEYLLDNLSDCNLKDVVIVVGYKGEMIEGMIGSSYKNCHITYIYNKAFETTDNFYSMYSAKNHIKHGMIFFNADVIFNQDILKAIISEKFDNSIATVDVDSPGAGKNPVRIKENEQGFLVDIGHDLGEQHKQMVFGIYKLSTETTKKYFNLAEEFFINGPSKGGFWLPLKKMASEISIKAIPVDSTKWVSINNVEEYNKAVSLISKIL